MDKRASAATRVTRSLTAAGLWPRIKAFAVDYLFIAGYLLLLTAGVLAARLTPLADTLARLYSNPNSAQLTDASLFDIPVMLYFALFESSTWQATPGKRWLGLRVVTTSGGRLRVPQALARIVVKFLPWEIAHTGIWHTPGWPMHAQPTPLNDAGYALVYVVVGAYLLSQFISPTRQTLYDWLTRSRVVFASR
jgi:uncharacterized RDD family membrane protein YckC